MFTRADRVPAHNKGRGSSPPLSKRLDILVLKIYVTYARGHKKL
jgi:hypothetical protein